MEWHIQMKILRIITLRVQLSCFIPCIISSMTAKAGSPLVQTPNSFTMFLWSNTFIVSASLKNSSYKKERDNIEINTTSNQIKATEPARKSLSVSFLWTPSIYLTPLLGPLYLHRRPGRLLGPLAFANVSRLTAEKRRLHNYIPCLQVKTQFSET